MCPRVGKREVAILDLLDWAFGRELVSIDFEDELVHQFSVGMEYVLMERAKLGGCRVDGGGRSSAHPDAELVAAALAQLPEAVGGRRMALRIAELARAGKREGWMSGARPRCVPREWRSNRHGRYAMTERAVGSDIWSIEARTRRGRKGRIIIDEPLVCPVVHLDTAREQAAARRAYLRWCLALREVHYLLRCGPDLIAWSVTDDFPDPAPWKKGA